MDNFEQHSQWVKIKSQKREDIIIDANLKLIEDLVKNLSNHEDKILVDKIIRVSKEIAEMQRGMIKELECDIQKLKDDNEHLRGVCENVSSFCDNKKEVEFKSEKILNSYMPLSKNGFETDNQLKKAFSNYLQYHNAKKLSKLTAYDYCSRTKNLWEPFICDWKQGKLEGIVHFSNERVICDSPLLNVYNNIDSIMIYVHNKFFNLEKGTTDHKNWANASAALNKFGEFKQMVESNK